MATVRAYQQTTKHIPFPVFGFSSADFPAFFLNLFPDGTVNNWLMHILKNGPVLTVIGNPLFVLVRLGIGLEVQDISAILLHSQHTDDRSGSPLRCQLLCSFSRLSDTFFQPVSSWGKDALRIKHSGDLVCSIALQDQAESKIKTELRPQENEQQNTVNAYKSYLRISSEIALIEAYATDFGNNLTALETEQKDDKSMNRDHPILCVNLQDGV